MREIAENLHSWNKVYTTAGRDGRDKSQLCITITTIVVTIIVTIIIIITVINITLTRTINITITMTIAVTASLSQLRHLVLARDSREPEKDKLY